MQAALTEHFSDLATRELPQGGLFFWLTLKQPLDTRTLLNRALAEDVVFMPGEPFFVEPDANPGYLRLNFSHVAAERMDEDYAGWPVIRDAGALKLREELLPTRAAGRSGGDHVESLWRLSVG